MKKDKKGLEILKELMRKGDLKLKVRLKETKEGRWALGTLTYQGKLVYRTQDPMDETFKLNTNASKNKETRSESSNS